MKYKIGDLVKFNVLTDESGWASYKWGVEPQLDKWITEIYTEELFGEVVRRNTIEVIYIDGKRSGRFYRMQNGLIQSESQKLRCIRDTGMQLDDIFDGSDLKTVKDFQTITQIPFIELSNAYEYHSCLNNPPNHKKQVSIWEKQNIGMLLKNYAYFDGIWRDSKTNEPIDNITENFKWKETKKRIFIDGQIFVQENI